MLLSFFDHCEETDLADFVLSDGAENSYQFCQLCLV